MDVSIARVYTDGGCSGNPGPGGWAYVIVEPEGVRTASGGEPATTNNRMELTAVIRALLSLTSRPERAVEVYTDSQYVKRGITEWIRAWRNSGWRNSAGDPVKNQDLWKALDELDSTHRPAWHWVRGHAGDSYNEQCDAMVRAEIRARK